MVMKETANKLRLNLGKRVRSARQWYRSRRLSWRVQGLSIRARARAKTSQLKLRRAAFEAGAVARSSATLSGISVDAHRVAEQMRRPAGPARKAAAQVSQAARHVRANWRGDLNAGLKELDRELDVLSKELKEGAERARVAAMRSSTVSGIAIDSRRAAKKLRSMRSRRDARPNH